MKNTDPGQLILPAAAMVAVGFIAHGVVRWLAFAVAVALVVKYTMLIREKPDA
ncbi:hypothetical protein [Sphingomonas sp.]|uniref:hypothetical protein n=1 Tax=Sphingomonas sp. TaxID=28214 RepID=UPI002E357654|nr:hypothetical protein [Sphingomonas sp.]HEX4695699.1 hypothetical protein [Sphingomonas sp.]